MRASAWQLCIRETHALAMPGLCTLPRSSWLRLQRSAKAGCDRRGVFQPRCSSPDAWVQKAHTCILEPTTAELPSFGSSLAPTTSETARKALRRHPCMRQARCGRVFSPSLG